MKINFRKALSYFAGTSAVVFEGFHRFTHVLPLIYLSGENESFEKVHEFFEPIIHSPIYNLALSGVLIGGVYHFLNDKKSKKYVSNLEKENSELKKEKHDLEFKLNSRKITF